MHRYLALVLLPLLVSATTTTSKPEAQVFTGQGCDSDHLFTSTYRSQIGAIAGDVHKIITHLVNATESGRTYQQLADFVDRFGSRLTGSENLEKSIDYVLDLLTAERHDNVHGEPVPVPKWTRGNEWAEMVRPRVKKLNILGLGYSVGTGGQTVEAPILVVRSFEDLDRQQQQAAGKIVVFNFKFESYGKQAIYRSKGASRAAKYGAVAAMIRSLTPFSINSPHTGMQSYDVNVTKIPAISITTEDADLFQRLVDRKEEVVVRFSSENKLHDKPAVSRNTVSEIVGSKYPKEVVLVSGHLDSWDVGQGAMDDGAGAFISWRALSVIRRLNLRPKRTMRSVLWTGEEMGLLGAKSYVQKHQREMSQFVLAMESDIGTFTPRGLTYSGTNRTAQCVMWEIMKLMAPIDATQLRISPEGSDVQMFLTQGVPIASLDTANEKYFYFHHTEGDTMTVESAPDLDKCQALWTGVAYALASLEHPLPR